MVDGHVNESVISATERIVIQQQSNNLKVLYSISDTFQFASRIDLFLLTNDVVCIFISRSYFPRSATITHYIYITHPHTDRIGRQNGRRLCRD